MTKKGTTAERIVKLSRAIPKSGHEIYKGPIGQCGTNGCQNGHPRGGGTPAARLLDLPRHQPDGKSDNGTETPSGDAVAQARVPKGPHDGGHEHAAEDVAQNGPEGCQGHQFGSLVVVPGQFGRHGREGDIRDGKERVEKQVVTIQAKAIPAKRPRGMAQRRSVVTARGKAP